MNEDNTQECLPKKLVQILVYLWICLFNVGMDFGLLLKAERSFGLVILIPLFAVCIGLSIHFTKELVNFFKEHGMGKAVETSPEIV